MKQFVNTFQNKQCAPIRNWDVARRVYEICRVYLILTALLFRIPTVLWHTSVYINITVYYYLFLFRLYLLFITGLSIWLLYTPTMLCVPFCVLYICNTDVPLCTLVPPRVYLRYSFCVSRFICLCISLGCCLPNYGSIVKCIPKI